MPHLYLLLSLVGAASFFGAAAGSMCTAPPAASSHNYSDVLSPSRRTHITFNALPGFTRSVYYRDHALITPESRVWAGLHGWCGQSPCPAATRSMYPFPLPCRTNALTSHFVSPASGANFAMYIAELNPGGKAGKPAPGAERFLLVLDGEVTVTTASGNEITLGHNDYAYFPPGDASSVSSDSGAGLLLYERVYALKGSPFFSHGHVDDSPLLPTAGEVFELRKLIPQTADYDFNIHVMDFKPGEHLFVKEVHYNQHGLLMLEGQGIYRLGDSWWVMAWYPVQAGDVIWMAPFVPQWYAALGSSPTRYIIYKDTIVDPLVSE